MPSLMTVAELVALLQEQKQDAHVAIHTKPMTGQTALVIPSDELSDEDYEDTVILFESKNNPL